MKNKLIIIKLILMSIILVNCGGTQNQDYKVVKSSDKKLKYKMTEGLLYDGEKFTNGEVVQYYQEMNNDLDPVPVDTEKIKEKKVLKDGVLTEYYSFFENGKPEITRFYENGDYRQLGQNRKEEIRYYENGQIEYKWKWIYGRYEDGEWLSYHPNGQIRSQGNYIKGDKDGEHLVYTEKGEILEKENYIKGNPHGEQIKYFGNLELESIRVYENGNLKRITSYHGNNNLLDKKELFGKIESITHYENGKKNGEYLEFYHNPKSDEYYLVFKGNYVNNEKDGEWIRNGRGNYGFSQIKTLYENGRRISESENPISYDEIKQ